MSEAATAPIASERAATPWLQRVAETPPWSPWRLAIAMAAALLVLFLAVELVFDRFPVVFGPGQDPWTEQSQVNFRITLVMILLVAYLPAAFVVGARGARGAIESILPALRGAPAELAALREEAGRHDASGLRRAGWIGIATAVAIPFWIDRELDAWKVWDLASEPVTQRVLILAIGWLGARFLYAVTIEARRLSRAGALVRVDLLDLRTFAPLTRQGLRYALLLVGLLSIIALYGYDYDKRGLMAVVVTSALLTIGATVTALLMPLRGARRAIQQAKRRELDWCEAELRDARATLERGEPATRPLGDLLAWRGLVLAVPEWPLDAPTLRRFFLYLAIPLGSWLGGAVVDRIVDGLLR
jgi:hypothetical protein